jgi:hypothetical protein
MGARQWLYFFLICFSALRPAQTALLINMFCNSEEAFCNFAPLRQFSGFWILTWLGR